MKLHKILMVVLAIVVLAFWVAIILFTKVETLRIRNLNIDNMKYGVVKAYVPEGKVLDQLEGSYPADIYK